MKLSKISENPTWKSLSFEHQHDDVIKTNDAVQYNTSDGFKIDVCSIQQHGKFSTSDKYTNYTLTDDVMASDLFTIETPVDTYPDQFTTTLMTDAYPNRSAGSAYVKVIETDDTETGRTFVVGQSGKMFTYVWSQDVTQNDIYFVVTLHDENTLSVSHDDNYANVYMTYSGDPNSGSLDVTFEQSHLDVPEENQRLGYYINRKYGFMLLYVTVNDVKYYVCPDIVTGKTFKVMDSRGLRNVSHPQDFVLAIDKSSRLINGYKEINNNWVSYSTVGNTNNLDVNTAEAISDVTNNTLITTDLQNIHETKLHFDILTLKNQVTYTGEMNRNNPFPNFRDCDHRDYDRIFLDDSHDIHDGLFLGYNSYEYEITLPVDQLTYFNTPQDMYPYERININDSNLIDNGAVGGDSPMAADKIFKKAASYKYHTPYGKPTDEESGVWLCAWLRSSVASLWQSDREYNKNIFVEYDGVIYKSVESSRNKRPDIWPDSWDQTELPPPTWVDRYYNPKKYSAVEALSFENPYTSYTTKFDFVVETLRAEDNYIFDKKSDLTFEPGCLYAYHHVGSSHIQEVINSLTSNVIHDGLSPVYGDNFDVIDNINDTVRFDKDNYIVTTAPAHVRSGDFTISFDLSAQDWSNVFGSQIIGNYTNQGLGVFNRMDITSYVFIPVKDTLFVYNTDMTLLFQLQVDEDIVTYTKDVCNENIVIYTSLSAITFDLNGTVVETTLVCDSNNVVLDACVTDEYYYVLRQHGTLAAKWTGEIENINVELLAETPGEDGNTITIVGDGFKTVLEFVNDWNEDNSHNKILVTSEADSNYVVPDAGFEITLTGGRNTGNNVIRQDINNERIDPFYITPIPTHVIGDKNFDNVSNNMFLQPIHDRDDIQYRINADNYTVDSNNDVWFIKENYVYRESLSDRNGAAATWEGYVDETRILLIAENGANGFVGNSIELTGNGSSTLFSLIAEWNELHNDNRVNLVEGLATVVPDDGFEMFLSNGRNQGESVLAQSFSAAPTSNIHDIICDYDDNVYVAYDTKIRKSNNIRRNRGDIDLSQLTTPIVSVEQLCMDMLVQLDDIDVRQQLLLLIRQDANSERVDFLKINTVDMTLIERGDISLSTDVDLNKVKTITQFENYKQLCKPTIYNNTLTFKTRFMSYFDSDKTHIKKLTYKTDKLAPGSHNFIFAFNGSNSNLALFVDGLLVETAVADDDTTGAAYKFTPTINAPIIAGAECSFNNITLSERVGIDQFNFARNCTLQSIQVYDKYITFQKINLISKQKKQLKDISFTLPAGKRNYIEHADQFYKHREPGNKSSDFDLFIVNQTLSSTETQSYLNDSIFEKIKTQLPANSNLNKINWVS